MVDHAAQSTIVAGRGVGRVIEASDRGLTALSKEMTVNALTPEAKATFQEVAIPEVKQLIVSKFGPEGEEMPNAFLETVAAAK